MQKPSEAESIFRLLLITLPRKMPNTIIDLISQFSEGQRDTEPLASTSCTWGVLATYVCMGIVAIGSIIGHPVCLPIAFICCSMMLIGGIVHILRTKVR